MAMTLLYRPEEAAELLGLGRAKVYELLGSGQLGSVRIGRARRIPAAALDQFVASLVAAREDVAPEVQRGSLTKTHAAALTSRPDAP